MFTRAYGNWIQLITISLFLFCLSCGRTGGGLNTRPDEPNSKAPKKKETPIPKVVPEPSGAKTNSVQVKSKQAPELTCGTLPSQAERIFNACYPLAEYYDDVVPVSCIQALLALSNQSCSGLSTRVERARQYCTGVLRQYSQYVSGACRSALSL